VQTSTGGVSGETGVSYANQLLFILLALMLLSPRRTSVPGTPQREGAHEMDSNHLDGFEDRYGLLRALVLPTVSSQSRQT